jgi:hypothetical protein
VIIHCLCNGRRLIGIDSTGQPAKDYASVTGWIYESVPVYRGKCLKECGCKRRLGAAA